MKIINLVIFILLYTSGNYIFSQNDGISVSYNLKEGFSYNLNADEDKDWHKGLPVDLKKATEFISHDNNLTSLPKELEQMVNLKIIKIGEYDDLTMKSKSVTSLPLYFKNFTQLEELIFVNQYITSIPFSFEGFIKLAKLSLEGNELTTFPDGIDKCPLTYLNVGNNQISTFPKDFNNLAKSLDEFYLQANEFKELDFWDPSLFKKLKRVDASGCPLSLEAVKTIYRSCKFFKSFIGVPSITKPSSLMDEKEYLSEFEKTNEDRSFLVPFWNKNFTYTDLFSFDNKNFVVYRGNYCAIANEKGDIIVPFERRGLGAVSEGLYAFEDTVTGLWGYKNLDGSLAVKAKYDVCYPFKENRAFIRGAYCSKKLECKVECICNNDAYIDRTGKIITQTPLCYGLDGTQHTMTYFSKFGLTEVAKINCAKTEYDVVRYVIDINGKKIYPNETYIDYIFYYEQPQIALKNTSGKWGIIDYTTGKTIFKFSVEFIQSAYEGGGKGKFFLLDKYIIAGVKNDKDESGYDTYLMGVMDLNGTWIIKPSYKNISNWKFSEESISVEKNGESYYINIKEERS